MIFPNFKRLWFNTKNFVTKSQKGYMNVHDALVNELVELGAITKDPCCPCTCGYNLSSVPSGPYTIESITVDGVVYTFSGVSLNSWTRLLDILSGLGFGQFSLYINGTSVEKAICIPKNSHEFGTLVLNDGEVNINIDPECPIVILS